MARDSRLSADELVMQTDLGGRQAGPLVQKVIAGLCILWSLFQLYIASQLPGWLATQTGLSFFSAMVTQARFIHLAFALSLASLTYPLFQHRRHIPFYDLILLMLGLVTTLYLVLFRYEIADRPGLWTGSDVVISCLGIMVLLIAVYRCLGLPLVIIASLFVLLVLFGGDITFIREATNYGGASLSKAVGHYWMQSEGVFGVALGVSTSMIFLFVLFGALLEKAGGGHWFIQVAIALLGSLRGGPAKAAVLSSMATGMISGSSIANTVTTGTFTIPLMKRIGFSKEKAGAVEVASSTNGQLTPPVMGAAAFLMVEYVNISYVDVVRHAFLPAVISYIALLYIVHLESLKLGLKGLEKDGRRLGLAMIGLLFLSGFLGLGLITYVMILLRSFLENIMPDQSIYASMLLLLLVYLGLVYAASQVPELDQDDEKKSARAPRLTPTLLSGCYFLLPIFVLVWNLIVRTDDLDRLSPSLSVFWATLIMSFVVVTHHPLKSFFRGQGMRPIHLLLGWGQFVAGLISGARNMIAISVATGAAGLIVGTISLTGAHQIIGELIEAVAGDNIMVLLILVAVLSLVLGMGLPTTANYIVVSSLMAPVIMSVGAQAGLVVPLIAVHLFVFYFGILADDTPPVGLAAYAAAAISRGDPIKTGVQGFAYDIRTALLPFMFIFNTDLLLIDVEPLHALLVFVISCIGMLAFAAVTQGYWLTRSYLWEQAVLLLVVFTLLRPGYWLDQLIPPFERFEAQAVTQALERDVVLQDVRITLEGPDFDSGANTTLTLSLPSDGKSPWVDQLQAQGLSIIDRGLRGLVIEEPFPGTRYFDQMATKFDFYGDIPVAIVGFEIPAERPHKEWFYVPGLILLVVVFLSQRRRQTVPAW